MSALLALDPGLDCTGWALFDLAGVTRPLWLPDAGQRLRMVSRWTTRPSDPDDVRLVSLVEQMRATLAGRDVTVVAIEAPPRPGLYRRHAKWGPEAMAKGVGYANALPALYLGAAAALGLRAFYARASETPKAARWTQYGPFLDLPGRSNQDERDAAVVGMQVLTDSRRKWAA